MKTHFTLVAVLCAAVAVALAQTDAGKKYVMFFPHESSEITSDAENVAQMAAANIRASAVKRVVITGYCDASEANPPALANARPRAAADKLRSLGVPTSVAIVVKASRDLVVSTAPGVSEPIDRQVAITF
jgi:outer membrane protein OmpA-like peptidoglycan-associated protein